MDESKELSLADLVAMVRYSWLLVLGLPVLAAVTAFAVTPFLQPTYRSVVLLSPTVPESGGRLAQLAAQFSPLTQLVGDLGASSGSSAKNVYIATLRSRWLTETFVHEKNLLPVLFPERWDSVTGDWKVRDGKREPPSMDIAFQLFDEKIRSVDEDRSTGLVSLGIEWHDRSVVAEWANDLVARANKFMQARTIAESRRGIEFLEEELGKTTVNERRQIIYRLIESKTSDIMLANSRDQYAFAVIDPAVQPDADNYIWPRRAVLTMISMFAGFFLAFIVAAIRWATRKSKGSAV